MSKIVTVSQIQGSVFHPVYSTEDVEHLALLARDIWTEHYTPIIGAEQVEYMLGTLHSPSVIFAQIENEGYRYFLLKSGNTSLGYIGFVCNENELFLSKIYVAASARGSGLGRKALEFVKKFAQRNGSKKIVLTVNKNNSNTISAYYKLGFIKTGEICVDIGEGYHMDDFQMELALV